MINKKGIIFIEDIPIVSSFMINGNLRFVEFILIL